MFDISLNFKKLIGTTRVWGTLHPLAKKIHPNNVTCGLQTTSRADEYDSRADEFFVLRPKMHKIKHGALGRGGRVYSTGKSTKCDCVAFRSPRTYSNETALATIFAVIRLSS
jgi:hypothetical protein